MKGKIVIILNVMSIFLLIFLVLFPQLILSSGVKSSNETQAKIFLKDADKMLGIRKSMLTFAIWKFNTDINDKNEKKVVSIFRSKLKFLNFFLT